MRPLKWLGVLCVVVGCVSSTDAVKVDDVKSGKIAEVPVDEGPSPADQMPPEFSGDRGDLLSFPVFPDGEVRFYADLEERDRDLGASGKARRSPQFCEIDRDCTTDGDRCLKPAGSPGTRGVCGRTTAVAGGPKDASGYVQSCKEEWECPDRFECVLVNGPFGVCVRLQ